MAVGNPTETIFFILSASNLKFFNTMCISLFLLKRESTAIIPQGTFANIVAKAAPPIPQWNTIIKSGSKNIFIIIPNIFNFIGLKVSPWDWWTAENKLIKNKNGKSASTIFKYVILLSFTVPSAPSHSTINGEKSIQSIDATIEKSIAHTKIWLAILFAFFLSSAPICWLIRMEPAIVIPCPKFTIIFCKGLTREIAAISLVPNFPSQNVSVRLYIVCIKLFITMGIAKDRRAFGIFPERINCVFFRPIFFT